MNLPLRSAVSPYFALYFLVSLVLWVLVAVHGKTGGDQPEIGLIGAVVNFVLLLLFWRGQAWSIILLFVEALILLGVAGPEIIQSADPFFIVLSTLAVSQVLVLLQLWDAAEFRGSRIKV